MPPKRKSPPTDFALGSFGCVSGFKFKKDGGYVVVDMDGPEISRLMECLQTYIIRHKKVPNVKALAAVDELVGYFGNPTNWGIRITADVILGTGEVRTEPVWIEHGPPAHGWDEKKRKTKNA